MIMTILKIWISNTWEDVLLWSTASLNASTTRCLREGTDLFYLLRPASPGDIERCKNLGSGVALPPGNFLVRPEIFLYCPDFFRPFPTFQTVSKPSGFFRIIFHFPDSFTTVWIFPDHFPFSRRCQNHPHFSGSFPISRTVSQLSGFSQIISHFQDGFKNHPDCLALLCLALCCPALYWLHFIVFHFIALY